MLAAIDFGPAICGYLFIFRVRPAERERQKERGDFSIDQSSGQSAHKQIIKSRGKSPEKKEKVAATLATTFAAGSFINARHAESQAPRAQELPRFRALWPKDSQIWPKEKQIKVVPSTLRRRQQQIESINIDKDEKQL